MRIALYDLQTRAVRVLDEMERGRSSNPQWAPDGKSLAFVSDRNGVPNVFLQELDGGRAYQLTDFYSGVHGITSL